MSTFPFSLIESHFDTAPRRKGVEWSRFVELMQNPRARRVSSIKDGPAFIPAVFREGGQRLKEDVEVVTAFVIDSDSGIPVEALSSLWEQGGQPLARVVYSTHSHATEHPKWRAVIPLAKPVPASRWYEIWARACFHLAEGKMDTDCCDPGHLYYLPSCPAHRLRDAFLMVGEGVSLDIEALPEPPPGWSPKPARPKREHVAVDDGADEAIPPKERLLVMALRMVHAGEGRNNTALWLSCQLRDNRYTQDDTERLIEEYVGLCPARAGDPFTIQEALKVVANAYRDDARAPWRKDRDTPPDDAPWTLYDAQATVEGLLPMLEKLGYRKSRWQDNGAIDFVHENAPAQRVACLTLAPLAFHVLVDGLGRGFQVGAESPFAIYAAAEHGGDWSAAARALLKAGIRDKPPAFDGVVPAPLTVDLLPVPAFDVDALLPAAWREWVADIAERSNTPPEYAAAAAIVAAASVIGARLGIRPKRQDDWTVTPNLWGAVVGPPGVLKSPATGEGLKQLTRMEMQALEIAKVARQEWEADQKVKKAKAAAAERKLAAMVKDGATDSELKQAALETVGGDEEQNGPPVRRFIINDATVEKLGEILADNPQGVLVYRDELTGFFKTLEKQGHESDRAFFLEAWNGDKGYTYDRIKRGTVHLPRLCVSLFGTIQPGPLARHIRATAEESDGLAQRFQVLVYPDPPTRFVNVDRWPKSEAKKTADKTFDSLGAMTMHTVGATIEDERGYLRFDSAAQAFFDAWRERLENSLLQPDDSSALQAHRAKYRSLMPSLALIFHLVENGTDNPGPVRLDSAQRAAVWCDLLEAHARRIYRAAMDTDPEAAQALGARIKASLPNPFTIREVVKKGWAGLSTPDEAERAVNLLEDRGWVKIVEEPATERGGRPSVKVHINPVVLGGFAGFAGGQDHRYREKSAGSEQSRRAETERNNPAKPAKPNIHDPGAKDSGEKVEISMGQGTGKTGKTENVVDDFEEGLL